MEFAVQIPCLLQYKTQPRSGNSDRSAVPYAFYSAVLIISKTLLTKVWSNFRQMSPEISEFVPYNKSGDILPEYWQTCDSKSVA